MCRRAISRPQLQQNPVSLGACRIFHFHHLLMLTTRRALIAIAGLAAMPAPLCAQDASVPIGEPVRVTWMDSMQSQRAIGTVLRITRDTLVFSTWRAPQVITLGRGSITKLETPVAESRGRSAALYGVLGATTWGGLTYVGDRGVPEPKRVLQSLAWGASGAVVGALLGRKFPRTRWRSVNP